MSDLEEGPKLSPEARAFLEKHAATGEPSAAALARVRERVLSPNRAVTPAPKRSWLPHEVMAAAAVLVVLVGAQGLYLYFRTPTESAGVKAVVEAYRAGDLEGAQRLASQSCSDAACKPLASSLAKALGLAGRIDSLSTGELEQLAALDAQLAAGADTPLGLRVAQRRKGVVTQPPGDGLTEAGQLYAEANALKKEKNLDQAALRLEKCVLIAPAYLPCYRALGSVLASIGARDSSANDVQRARGYYERYLELAPADDEFVPKVRAILEASEPWTKPDQPLPRPASTDTEKQFAEQLYLEANTAKLKGNWPRALELARQAVQTDPNHTGALAILLDGKSQARDLYLRGYQLRDSSPDEAIRIFQEVMALTPPDDQNHQKAKSRIAELGGEPEQAAPEEGADAVGPGVIIPLHGSKDLAFDQDVVRVALGDTEIADVAVTGPRQLRVKGASKGKTTLLVWFTDGHREATLLDVR